MGEIRSLLTFNRAYFLRFIGLFLIVLTIALFVHDRWIRPYGGDLLVVILLYCFVKSFVRVTPLVASIGVLLFSFFVELLQACDIARILGFGNSPVMMTVIGSIFSWEDLVAYSAGIAVVMFVEVVGKRCSLKG